MRCEEVREALPAYARSGEASLSIRRHLSSCEGCTEELHRYEALLNGLAALRAETAPAPVGLAGALRAIPSRETRLQHARTHIFRHKGAYLGGLALAAAGAGAMVWRSRVRTVAA